MEKYDTEFIIKIWTGNFVNKKNKKEIFHEGFRYGFFMPYSHKYKICSQIFNDMCLKRDDKFIRIEFDDNSIEIIKNLLYIYIYMDNVEIHTNYKDKQEYLRMIWEYNSYKSCGFLKDLKKYIPESELNEFEEIFNGLKKDCIINTKTIINMINMEE